MEKQKEKDEKSTRPSRKRPSTSKQEKLFFFPSPTPLKKYKPTFSPNVPSFRDFFPCFISNLPTPHKIPFTLRAGHAPTRIYAPAHSANFPFLPSPFTLAHNKLYISLLSVKANPAFTFTLTATTWDTTPCTTFVAKNRWRQKGEAFTRNAQSINVLHPNGEEVKAKIEKHWTRAREYAYYL